jgi:fucose 4-O-acetylase-like acetyltransferase
LAGLVFVARLYFAVVVLGDAPGMAMKRGDYGWPFVTFVAAVAGTAVCMRARRLVASCPYGGSLLTLVGATSIVIMYVHVMA